MAVDNEQEDYGLPEREAASPSVGKKFDQHRNRELMRNGLASVVLGLLCVVVLVPMWQVAVGGNDWANYEGMVGSIVPGVLGIAGTILGFYFGSKDGK